MKDEKEWMGHSLEIEYGARPRTQSTGIARGWFRCIQIEAILFAVIYARKAHSSIYYMRKTKWCMV